MQKHPYQALPARELVVPGHVPMPKREFASLAHVVCSLLDWTEPSTESTLTTLLILSHGPFSDIANILCSHLLGSAPHLLMCSANESY